MNLSAEQLRDGSEIPHLISHEEVVEDEAPRENPGVTVPASQDKTAREGEGFLPFSLSACAFVDSVVT